MARVLLPKGYYPSFEIQAIMRHFAQQIAVSKSVLPYSLNA